MHDDTVYLYSWLGCNTKACQGATEKNLNKVSVDHHTKKSLRPT